MAHPRSRRPVGRTRRPAGRRTSTGRSRKPSRGSTSGRLPFGLVAILIGGAVAWHWLAERPALLVGVGVALAVLGVAALTLWLAWIRSARRRRTALARSVEATDRLSGPQFEKWVADLMRRTGFTRVHISGGAGDLGADILALARSGRRVVVQCKRYQVGRSVGSAEVQKLAGTARAIHDADIAAIVTNSSFTRPAREVAARLGVGLVDRDVLARWATDGLPPLALTRPAPKTTGAPEDGLPRRPRPRVPARRSTNR